MAKSERQGNFSFVQGVHEEPDTLQIATVVKKKEGRGCALQRWTAWSVNFYIPVSMRHHV